MFLLVRADSYDWPHWNLRYVILSDSDKADRIQFPPTYSQIKRWNSQRKYAGSLPQAQNCNARGNYNFGDTYIERAANYVERTWSPALPPAPTSIVRKSGGIRETQGIRGAGGQDPPSRKYLHYRGPQGQLSFKVKNDNVMCRGRGRNSGPYFALAELGRKKLLDLNNNVVWNGWKFWIWIRRPSPTNFRWWKWKMGEKCGPSPPPYTPCGSLRIHLLPWARWSDGWGHRNGSAPMMRCLSPPKKGRALNGHNREVKLTQTSWRRKIKFVECCCCASQNLRPGYYMGDSC